MVWANLSCTDWVPRHQAHENDRLTLRIGTMDRGRTGRGIRTSASPFGGGASSRSQGAAQLVLGDLAAVALVDAWLPHHW